MQQDQNKSFENEKKISTKPIEEAELIDSEDLDLLKHVNQEIEKAGLINSKSLALMGFLPVDIPSLTPVTTTVTTMAVAATAKITYDNHQQSVLTTQFALNKGLRKGDLSPINYMESAYKCHMTGREVTHQLEYATRNSPFVRDFVKKYPQYDFCKNKTTLIKTNEGFSIMPKDTVLAVSRDEKITLASINSSHISNKVFESIYQIGVSPPRPQSFYDLHPQKNYSNFSIALIGLGIYGVGITTVAIFNKILTGNWVKKAARPISELDILTYYNKKRITFNQAAKLLTRHYSYNLIEAETLLSPELKDKPNREDSITFHF